ncbi:MCE family protein [Nocardioides sp. J9]|uniref:MCE family protein n=1 Tax=Nocardioides sp. J9 TaxID=935844 RepID=UPI001647FCA7|nr:MlaD family protein [Nocardioides sp. J9]
MFRERNPLPLGIIVLVWLAASILLVLNINGVVGMFGRQYTAVLPEAAGLTQGAPVRVSGMTVGRVGTVELGDEGVVVRFSLTNAHITLGDETTATVSVETVLGDKALVLESAGNGELASGAQIPLERTTAPYDVNEALGDLQRETEAIDVRAVAKAMDTVSETLEGVTPAFSQAVNGVSRLSQTVSSRDAALQSLLRNASSFSKVLAGRSDDLTAIMKDGSKLFTALTERRRDIKALLTNVTTMSQELRGLVKDNEQIIGPALEQLNKVVAVLQENEQNITKILTGLSTYVTGMGEVVAGGPFFNATLQNLLPGNLLQPDLSALGFKDPMLEGAGR